MTQKILTLAFIMASSMVFMPVEGSAAVVADPPAVGKTSPPQIRVRIGNGRRNNRWWRNRGRHRGWERRSWNRRHHNNRMVRQVYYINGRRYVRWVRSY